MIIKTIVMWVLLLIACNALSAQQQVVFNMNQPDSLIASAGADIYVPAGDSVIIGGLPSASGGVPPYVYCWSPATYLNDSSLSNPVVSPQSSLVYTLMIIDHNFCTSYDSALISIDSSSIHLQELNTSGYSPHVYYAPVSRQLVVVLNIFFELFAKGIVINIYDVRGRQLLNYSLPFITDHFISIPLNNMPSIIFVYVSYDQLHWSYKLVIR